ncbi:prepilin peptidase [Longimicrobium terrae]|uniref:Leader peptidase (Prepilin peptidase)/N-methyltransferase n=1 Tax=Longimicrobium terrae TaxID=1639882 RepID=A0A841H1Q6_9BACT|nr:A24 family peptidase [Longimicrobium terrae]MBB4637614.1 leader peptidase (prepilin peptidase)/N-methyltransferase [Longimicrobium terrae]MBB6072011.1 leader peptidase (prepilin peptidase)/N-methyltransferase [Longimicrobium terrae]NNC29902.1 prepilin peptidase [Longimicrobium terrae]
MALLLAYAAVIGACVGSFLNVCVYRWPAELSVIRPPSRCGSCGTPIRWFDNVPILGWMILRGRCRACGAGVSIQYPLVEAGTAAIWVISVLRYGVEWQALVVALFFTILLGIALSDAKTYIIPDEFTWGGAAIGFALSFAPGGVTWMQSLIGGALGFGLLWLIAVVGEWAFKKPAMGGGDIKMMLMVGAFLGPWGVLLTLFLGALFGTLIFAPISMKTGKLVPFGIFLALGAAITEPLGQALIDWYVRNFLVV